uniref:Uncharacterized protein n=1 Tax=Arundo donax TaxID=35708 RepID=A0A0A9CJI3_ARUDO
MNYMIFSNIWPIPIRTIALLLQNV